MFKVYLKLNGRPISSKHSHRRTLEEIIEAKLMGGMERNIRETLVNQARCPVHKQEILSVTLDGKNINDISAQVSCCCDEFKQEVERRLQN